MKGEIQLQEHYGTEVLVNRLTEDMRRDECLCLNCGSLGSCWKASQMLEVCKRGALAAIVTRCPTFTPKGMGEK